MSGQGDCCCALLHCCVVLKRYACSDMAVLCSEIVLQEDFLQQLEWKDGKIYDALNKLFDISYQPYKDNSVLKYVVTVPVAPEMLDSAACCSKTILDV